MKNVRGFVILRPEEGLTSFNKANSVSFFVEKNYNEAFRGVHSF